MQYRVATEGLMAVDIVYILFFTNEIFCCNLLIKYTFINLVQYLRRNRNAKFLGNFGKI